MDHHKSRNISATITGFEDQYYYGRKPNGIYIPCFRNIFEKRTDYIRGFGTEGSAWRDEWGRGTGDAGVGASLKQSITEPGDWRMGFVAFGECLPYAENRVLLNTTKKIIGEEIP